MAQRRLAYPVNIIRDEEGFYLVTFPDLPEAGTDALTVNDALIEARDCLEEALAARVTNKEEIPLPSIIKDKEIVHPHPLFAAKIALYIACREKNLTNVALSEKLGCDEKETRRLLNPRHNTRLNNIEKALNALGKELIVEIKDVPAG